MQLIIEDLSYTAGDFRLTATGTFGEGVHLLSGRVGSGKSTFATLASGMARPTSGTLRREGIGTVLLSLQFPEYHVTGISVAEEVRSWGLDPGRILAASRMEARGGEDIARLSRGELKRLHLECVLSAGADLLILDEPFSALDCREKIAIGRRIAGRNKGITLLCTHEQAHLPDVDFIWEIESGVVHCRGRVPDAIARWNGAPRHIRALLDEGITPHNISPGAVEEALCRTLE